MDRIAAAQFGDLPPRLLRAISQVVRHALRPNLAYNDAETRRRQEAKRAQVKDVLLQVRKGEKIIGDGEQVTKTHLLIFHALRAAGRAGESEQVRWEAGCSRRSSARRCSSSAAATCASSARAAATWCCSRACSSDSSSW